jgi:hypothetical protein
MGLELVGSGKEPTPRLVDIVAMLRSYASRLEAGILAMPETLIYVNRYDDGEIIVGAFGENPSKCELVGMLTLAGSKFTTDPTDSVRG